MPVPDAGKLYATARQRLAHLARAATPDDLARRVPATPAWTVAEVVAHLAGVAADYSTGVKAEEGRFDEWTQAHVDSRRGRALDDVLDEWEVVGSKLEPMLAEQRVPFQLYDVELHEQDVRAALDQPGARDSPGLHSAADTAVSILGRKLDAAGLPAVRFRGSDGDRVAGSGEPEVTAQVDTYELVRALFGRRTRSQMAAWDWGGADPAAYTAEMPAVFGPPAADLVE